MQVKNVFFTAGAALLIASCNQVDFKKTKGGMPYKLFASEKGKKVENGKFVKAHVVQKVKDSVMLNTYAGLPVYFQVNPSEAKYDISELFTTLKEGDSVYAVQAMDTFIKRSPAIVQQTPYRNGDKVTTSIKILKVFDSANDYRQDEEKEKLAIVKTEETAVKDYLSKNKITAQRTGTGTYVQVQTPGGGEPVVPGKYVTVKYTGQTFGGKVFDSNIDSSFGHTDPLGFTVGTGQMIKGFDEGVQLLKEGGKARIFIPSMLAYGAQPPSPTIKPFEHLIFDVEVVDVTNAPAQPNFPPQVDPTHTPH